MLPFYGLKLNQQLGNHRYAGTVDTVGVCVVREKVSVVHFIHTLWYQAGWLHSCFLPGKWLYWLNKHFWLAQLREGTVRLTLLFCWRCFQRTVLTKSLRSFGIVGILSPLASWCFIFPIRPVWDEIQDVVALWWRSRNGLVAQRKAELWAERGESKVLPWVKHSKLIVAWGLEYY